MKEKKPNLFIIGAPKCGTTALAVYLSDNPNIFMSNPKEPHFFATDIPKYRQITEMEDYLKIFDSAENKQSIIVEASVLYLYSNDAIKNIHDFNKEAKIIIMLRNPLEMVYSWHSQLLYSGDEEVENFSEALSLEKNRKQGKKIPLSCRDSKVLYYSEIAKYGEQIEKLYSIFPKEQIKIIIFDDFKTNTLKVYLEVLDFLGLSHDEKVDFPKINENKVAKNQTINRLLKRQPQAVKYLKNKIKKILGKEDLGIWRFVSKINTVQGNRKPLDKKLKTILISYYKDDIFKLSSIIDKNLDNWLK